MTKLIAWIFRPSADDEKRNWKGTSSFRPAHFGEVRLRDENDVPMSNEQFFQPGWKRAEWLDEPKDA